MAETVTFTGTRWPPYRTAGFIRETVGDLDALDKIIVGGAPGVDELVAMAALEMNSGHSVYAVLPCTTDPEDISWLDRIGGWEQMPAGTTFKQRDARMVELGDRVIAFPLYREDDARMKRSGTWITVRIARKAGKSVEVHVLSELEP
jgi:precorrin-2 methylase